MQEQASTLQRLGQLTRCVGGEYDERLPGCRDRAQLRHRDLEVGEDLEQQAFNLDIRLVGLVDE